MAQAWLETHLQTSILVMGQGMLWVMRMCIITYTVPYCEKLQLNDTLQELCELYIKQAHFQLSFKWVKYWICSERLFQAVGPAIQKARSPNFVWNDHHNMKILTPDVRPSCADGSCRQKSAMYPGSIPGSDYMWSSGVIVAIVQPQYNKRVDKWFCHESW